MGVEDSENITRTEVVVGITSFISFISSLTIIITYWRFKEIRNQVYLQLIFYISICDCLSSFFLISTFQDGSALCWVQGIFLNYFQLAAVLWVDVIVWHLYKTVKKGPRGCIYVAKFRRYHKFAWGLPLLYIIGTLITNNYGTSNGDSDGYCWVVDRKHFPTWSSSLWEVNDPNPNPVPNPNLNLNPNLRCYCS